MKKNSNKESDFFVIIFCCGHNKLTVKSCNAWLLLTYCFNSLGSLFSILVWRGVVGEPCQRERNKAALIWSLMCCTLNSCHAIISRSTWHKILMAEESHVLHEWVSFTVFVQPDFYSKCVYIFFPLERTQTSLQPHEYRWCSHPLLATGVKGVNLAFEYLRFISYSFTGFHYTKILLTRNDRDEVTEGKQRFPK